MQPVTLLLAFVAMAAAADAAATTTSSSSTSTGAGTIMVTGTALPALVTETEPCALLCYEAACLDSGCGPSDFACVCQNPHSLVVKMGLCVGTDCDNQAQFDSGQWMASICNVYQDDPSSSDIAAASSLIAGELSAAAATATDNPVPSGTIENDSGATTTAETAKATSTAASAADAPRPYGRWAAIVGGGAVAVAAMI